MNNEGVLVIGGSIVLALVGFGFKYAKDNPQSFQNPVRPQPKPLVTFEKKDIWILNSPPVFGQDLDRTKKRNATPLDMIQNRMDLNNWEYDENTVKAMLYTMQRIVDSPKWFDLVKEKADNKNRSVNVQLGKDARYVLEEEGLDIKDKRVHITFETAERYMEWIEQMQIDKFHLDILNATF